MKYARQMLGVFYILISVFTFISLGGCEVGYGRGGNRGYIRGDNRADRHYYRDGRWYKHDDRGNEVSVADIVLGAIADVLPPQHQTIVVQNTPYYYDNSHYYRQRPEGGYIVVAAPRR